MALYADALKKYQNFLGGTDTQRLNTATDPSGVTTATQPAPGGASSEPTKTAPSVPTSTNAEQTDFRSYDQDPTMGTAMTGTVAPEAQSDPYADLAAAQAQPPPAEPAQPFEQERADFAPPPVEPTQDELRDQALADLLAGQRDTSEDEAMIREQVEADMLQGVVDNQARMGAMGFGSSGALAGLDADIRGRASLDAADQIMGVREDARDDWLRRVGTGLGADLTQREFASREAARDAYADLLRDLGRDYDGDGVTTERERVRSLVESGEMEAFQGSYDDAIAAGYTEPGEVYEYVDEESGRTFTSTEYTNPQTGETVLVSYAGDE